MKRRMLTVRDIMTTDLLTFTPENTIRDAIEGLTNSHLSGAPVVSGEKVVGVISMTDVLSFIVSSPEAEEPETEEATPEDWDEPDIDEDELNFENSMESDSWEEPLNPESTTPGKSFLEHHTVEEAMTSEVFSVPSTATVKDAATMMGKRGIHRVLVVNDGTLAGIVSSLDIARAVSERGLRGISGVSIDPCPKKPSPWIDI